MSWSRFHFPESTDDSYDGKPKFGKFGLPLYNHVVSFNNYITVRGGHLPLWYWGGSDDDGPHLNDFNFGGEFSISKDAALGSVWYSKDGWSGFSKEQFAYYKDENWKWYFPPNQDVSEDAINAARNILWTWGEPYWRAPSFADNESPIRIIKQIHEALAYFSCPAGRISVADEQSRNLPGKTG